MRPILEGCLLSARARACHRPLRALRSSNSAIGSSAGRRAILWQRRLELDAIAMPPAILGLRVALVADGFAHARNERHSRRSAPPAFQPCWVGLGHSGRKARVSRMPGRSPTLVVSRSSAPGSPDAQIAFSQCRPSSAVDGEKKKSPPPPPPPPWPSHAFGQARPWRRTRGFVPPWPPRLRLAGAGAAASGAAKGGGEDAGHGRARGRVFCPLYLARIAAICRRVQRREYPALPPLHGSRSHLRAHLALPPGGLLDGSCERCASRLATDPARLHRIKARPNSL